MTQNSRFPGEKLVHFGTILEPYLVYVFCLFFGSPVLKQFCHILVPKGTQQELPGFILGVIFRHFWNPVQK